MFGASIGLGPHLGDYWFKRETNPSVQIAGFVGFCASAVVAEVLVIKENFPKQWAVVLVVIGVFIPIAVVRWRESRRKPPAS